MEGRGERNEEKKRASIGREHFLMLLDHRLEFGDEAERFPVESKGQSITERGDIGLDPLQSHLQEEIFMQEE